MKLADEFPALTRRATLPDTIGLEARAALNEIYALTRALLPHATSTRAYNDAWHHDLTELFRLIGEGCEE